jgi:hypothetical protein
VADDPAPLYPIGAGVTIGAGSSTQETRRVVANAPDAPPGTVTFDSPLAYDHDPFEVVEATSALPDFQKDDRFVMARTADRSANEMFLDGKTLTGEVGISYVPKPAPVSSVEFRLDGTLVSTDHRAPYDLIPSDTIDARLLDTSLLTNGEHTLVAKAITGTQTVSSETATFTVDSAATRTLRWSSEVDRSNSASLHQAVLPRTGAHAFLSSATRAIPGAPTVRYVLDGTSLDTDTAPPYDIGDSTTGGGVADLPFRARQVGSHRITTTYDFGGAKIPGPAANYRVT